MEAHGPNHDTVIKLMRQQAHNLMDENVLLTAKIIELQEALEALKEKNNGTEDHQEG